MNQIRSFLPEFGIVIKQGRAALTQIFPEGAIDAALPLLFRQSIVGLADTLLDLEKRIDALNRAYRQLQQTKQLRRYQYLHYGLFYEFVFQTNDINRSQTSILLWDKYPARGFRPLIAAFATVPRSLLSD